MFDRPGSGDAAILVDLDFGNPDQAESVEYGRIARLRVSAKTGQGMDLVRQALAEHALPEEARQRSLRQSIRFELIRNPEPEQKYGME